MSLSEPKRNASVNSKPLHRVCKLEFLVFLEFNLRDLKLRVITVFYPLAPIFLTCFWLQNQWNESLSWHLKNVLKKCIQHTLSRQFSHIKLVVVGFFVELRGGQFSVDFLKYFAVETEVISQKCSDKYWNIKIHVRIRLWGHCWIYLPCKHEF